MALTKRQEQVLEVIRRTVAEHGYQPSIREIAASLGLSSPSSVHCHIKALERAGALQRVGARAVKLPSAEGRTTSQ